MRVFIAVLVLIFSFQSLSKADDIKDFEIEGMSIDRSLLDFFSENEIDRDYVFPNREFATFANVGKNFKTYDPSIICIEILGYRELGSEKREIKIKDDEIYKFLVDKNYKKVWSGSSYCSHLFIKS